MSTNLSKEEIQQIFDLGEVYRLKNGRSLGYIRVGMVASKQYVVFCNGSPSSRLEALVYVEAAKAAGVCVICVDRFGYGKSDPCDNPSLFQYASDIDELLTSMNINKYSVIGASAGGPNALTLMYVAKDKVQRGALIALIGPIYQTGTQGMMGFLRFFFFLGVYTPWMVGFLLKRIMVGNKEKMVEDPAYLDKMCEEFMANAQGYDKAYVASTDLCTRMFFCMSRAEAFATGEQGVKDYNTVLTQPWGFDIEEIQTPVDIYASHDDDMVPLCMAEHIAKQLPHATTHWCHGEGHTSVIGRKIEDALTAIHG